MGKFGDFVKKIGLDIQHNIENKKFAEKFFKDKLYNIDEYIKHIIQLGLLRLIMKEILKMKDRDINIFIQIELLSMMMKMKKVMMIQWMEVEELNQKKKRRKEKLI